MNVPEISTFINFITVWRSKDATVIPALEEAIRAYAVQAISAGNKSINVIYGDEIYTPLINTINYLRVIIYVESSSDPSGQWSIPSHVKLYGIHRACSL